MIGRAIEIVRPVLIDKVERDHWQSDAAFLRRRIVVAVTLALGALLLGLSFSLRQGDLAFYPLTFGLAATWALGGLLSGPLHLGRVLLAGGLRRQPSLPSWWDSASRALRVGRSYCSYDPIARQARRRRARLRRLGNLWIILVITLVNGVAEELFFRVHFAAIGVRRCVDFHDSLCVDDRCRWQSRTGLRCWCPWNRGGAGAPATGGILAPILTHITWSLSMLFVLPPLFAASA